jgi:hypothetical protein
VKHGLREALRRPAARGVVHPVVVRMEVREDDVIHLAGRNSQHLELAKDVPAGLDDVVGVTLLRGCLRSQVAKEAVAPEHVVGVPESHRAQVDEGLLAGRPLHEKAQEDERQTLVGGVGVSQHVIRAERADPRV